jgi:hypothetical protein
LLPPGDPSDPFAARGRRRRTYRTTVTAPWKSSPSER